MQTRKDNFYYEERMQSAEMGDYRNDEQSSEVKKLLKQHFKLAIAGVILIVVILIVVGKNAYDDYKAKQVQHDYSKSFFDGNSIFTSYALSSLISTENEKIMLTKEYINLMLKTIKTEEVPKNELKCYNNSVQRILGEEAKEYIVDERWNIDHIGFIDGVVYNSYCYSMEVAHDCGAISDEEYNEFKRRDKALLNNLSHEGVEEMLQYMNELLEKGFGKITISDAFYPL